ncbi:hypothetical protein SAMN04489735_1002163 [Aneurinibacillus thermoaerophilus]|uniref:Glyoxalase/Bleomycin resistance protein/Dioxygenase superfamily protein n=1 Tax=Aneurinibacillus thermoaerophilus TaxID=143495 RepID=A0A1G7WVV1_ANETH|nr:hypothetical protein [Aneurinibacillus thermoaerophilus]MED0674115.1 hypothetical protein [Aneurinibacillus thermoaerophilus]SDG76024.1 hypothetical protein SAMN04489735_1002163 [Aneurinibacillus thermoaerophilus]
MIKKIEHVALIVSDMDRSIAFYSFWVQGTPSRSERGARDGVFVLIAHYKAKGIVFNTEEPKPTLEGGRMILFYGPDRELLQFVEPGQRER